MLLFLVTYLQKNLVSQRCSHKVHMYMYLEQMYVLLNTHMILLYLKKKHIVENQSSISKVPSSLLIITSILMKMFLKLEFTIILYFRGACWICLLHI